MYVDFNSNQIVVLGAVYGKWEACSKQFDKLRAATDENGERTVIGRDCLRGQVIQLEIVGGHLVTGKSHSAEKCKRGGGGVEIYKKVSQSQNNLHKKFFGQRRDSNLRPSA